MRRLLLLVAIAFVLLVLATSAHAAPRKKVGTAASDDDYKWTWKSSLSITTEDGIVLRADAFVPVPKAPNETFPVVIFPNSWGCPQIEYITRALNLAGRGYIALEYETRGWYISGGQIDTAGPLDRSDGSTIIDFVESNKADWNADMSNVAFMGISYGAGISLMMAGNDYRVKTALALSGWNNITYMLYGNEVPNTHEGHSLIESAKKHGNISPALLRMFDDLLLHQNMDYLMDFANERTPEKYLGAINNRNVPLFISSNYMDRLFRPQYMLEFFAKITSPKHLLLNQGGHAFPEAIGLLAHTNFIWTEAYEWLDFWLRNESTGIMQKPTIEMQRGASVASTDYVDYTSANKGSIALYWGPRGAGTPPFGTLTPQPPNSGATAPIKFTVNVTLDSGKKYDTEMAIGIPYQVSLLVPDNSTALVFQSTPFQQNVEVCGTPTVDVVLSSTSDNWQFYTYLYEVSPTNTTIGSLLSYGFYNHYIDGPTAGPVAEPLGNGRWSVRGAQLHTICRTIAAGNSVAVGVVLYSPMLGPANNASSLAVSFEYGASALNLPNVTWSG